MFPLVKSGVSSCSEPFGSSKMVVLVCMHDARRRFSAGVMSLPDEVLAGVTL